MAIFGRRSARERLRSAARESLTIPAFSAPVDCSAWVLGGLWPAELTTTTPETAQLADYLNADLQRIANSANEKLHAIGRSGLAGQARQAAEARVINVARAFAVLRVESTVRQLHKEALEFRTEYVGINAAPVAVEPVEQIPTNSGPTRPAGSSPEAAVQRPRAPRHRLSKTVVVEPPDLVDDLEAPIPRPVPTPPAAATPPRPVTPPPAPDGPRPEPDSSPVPEVAETLDVVEPDRPGPPFVPGRLVVDSADEKLPTTTIVPDPVVAPPLEQVVAPPAEAVVASPVEQVVAPPVVAQATVPAAPEPPNAPPTEPAAPSPPARSAVAESEEQRLQRLLAFVARQEPGLRWAIGTFDDGSTLLVTDIANGWIPSGIELPAGVRLLEPGRRTGSATEMLGTPTESASYSPGDRLGWASDFGATETSVEPRELVSIEDLGWRLSEATHWREGLPRMANTLAKAGSTGTEIVEAEIDLLRVHLDTLRYQLLAQYPDSDAGLVLNCMLLAATEGIATGDGVLANYHYSWFRTLSTPPVSQGDPQR